MSDRAQQQQFSDSEIDLLELPLGIFTAGETGKVSFDLLFEKNQVGGDLGLVRLEEMESLEVDSVEFKREVIQRAKSQSALGRSIFSDRTAINATPKTQTVQMNPGETFALVFFPKSSKGAIANPTPVLSLNAGKFADVGDGCTVAMDIAKSSQIDALTGQLERLYTDLIFRVEGATGQLEKLDVLVTSEQDWRTTSFGQEILTFTAKSVVEMQEKSVVEVEEVETEAIDLFVDAGELETKSGFDSQIFNESNGETEKGDREIVDDLPQGNSGKDRSEIESESHFGDAIEIEENSSSSYSTNEPIEKEIETTRSHSGQLEQTQKIPDHPFASGVFTVGETGAVGINFLFDGGKYKSELAIFSLEGMGEYKFGSTKFIEEATHRALSNSKSGYVVIQDHEEGAKFEGELGEKSWNKGEYKGIKTFQMEAGTQFGIMLIPNGTVKQANKNPKIGGAKKPLFSMALAGKDYGQIADLNGERHTFAMEDVQPTHKWFDRDYNDIIFQVKGATGTAQSFDNAINPEKDWRQTPLGQEILEYIKTPDRAPENLRLLSDRLYNPGESLSFSGWVMDADGGADIDRVDLWLQKDGGEWQDIDDATDFSVNGDRAFFHHELGALEPGRYRLKAIPRDRGGAEGEAYEQTFTVLGDKLSNRVKWAIERSMNLDSYDPQALQATQKWLVSVRSGSSALQLAELLGARNLGATGRIPNTHTWEFPKGTDPQAMAELLAQTIGIEYAYPLVAKKVEFYNAPANEPLVANGSQWHLQSNGQFDANITETWTKHGVYGKNVTVGIVDGGFSVEDSHNETHPEFLANYRQDLSKDFDERDEVPSGLLRGTAELPRESTIFPYQWRVNHILHSLVLGTIEKLFVEVEIDHPDIHSLDVKLVSPNGDRIALNLDGDGEFEGELTAFNGQVADGDWKLEIVNPQHIGFIKEFRLNFTTENHHGTKVAGVAVADGRNNLGGSGVAPDAEKAFLRLGSDGLTSEEAEIGLTHEGNQIDIFSSSWGLGEIFDVLPGGEIALEYGAKQGRNGLGNVHLFAAGNNQKDDWGVNRYGNVNYNAFANSRHTIAVGAIDHTGLQAGYSAPGASLIVAAHSNSGKKDSSDRPIVTTKRYSDDGNDDNDYTIRSYSEVGEDFGGTSAATPLVSGVVALMLEANPHLTARDVQAILIQTAQKNDPNDSDWVQNDAGYWVNHKYGFGAVDADAAVDLAKNWVSLGQEQMVWGKARSGEFIPELEDPNDLKPLTSEIEISPATDLAVEWVEIEFVATHQYLGDLEIVLISPEGTRSVLAEQHYDAKKYGPSDRFSNTYHWFFTSVRHWGESATGTWKLQVTDRFVGNYGFDHPQEAHHANILTGWQINLYGTEPNTPPEASPLNQSHNYTEDVPLMLTPIFVTDADGDNISAVLQLSDASAGELRSGSAISNNGILQINGSINQINALLSTVEFVPTEHFNGNLVIETAVTDGKIGAPLTGEIALTGTPVNDAPTLEEVALSGAIAGQPLTITHADLLAASNASDVEGDAIAFIIEALNSGTLTQNGNAIALGTQISAGDVLEWTPEGSGDDISAFSIKATDGIDASVNAVNVTVDVASPLNTAPELSAIATLTGATTGQSYTITHADLLAASNAVDADGDAIAFAIESLLSGSLTINGNAANVGDEVTATDTLVWTPDSAGNDVGAFSVKASDGQLLSGNAVTVGVDVVSIAPPNIVTNTKDSGAGSLRAAIEWANANPGTDTITFDIATTDPGYNAVTGTFTIQPLSALPEITDAIAIDTTTQPGFTDKPIIELDGSFAGNGTHGLTLNTENSTIRGFVINRFDGSAIHSKGADNNTIAGNYLGTDVTGAIALGNQWSGVSGWGTGNIIGGMDAGDRNLISGNQDGGVYVSMSNTQVINNYIGTNLTGTQDLGNSFGVRFHHHADNIVKNNLISGNDGYGVFFDGNGSENNIVQGNFIGTSADGMSAIANNGDGILLTTSTNNTIGGTTPETSNLISGNTGSGLNIRKFRNFYSTSNQVYGNYIGTDITGTQSLSNGKFGIEVHGHDNAIGGTNAGEGNVISGNTFDGVLLGGENNALISNLIGVDKDGMNALGNGNDGIQIGGDGGAGNNNTISGNNIAFNTKDGIFLNQGSENVFSENNIYNNDGAGIAFKPGYNTNDGQVAPILTAATVNGAMTTVEGTFSETPNTVYRLEFFGNPDNDGEGFTFLGFEEVTTDGNGNASFNTSLSGLVGGQFVTATATDAQGNTSRFSTGVEVELPPLPKQQVTVTVHRIKEVDNIDWGDLRGGADFRTTIGINGAGWTSPAWDDGNDISPNWQFSQEVTGATIPISIKVEDDDSYDLLFTTIEDFEKVDVNPQSGNNTLYLTYNLLTGEVSGSGVSGVAGQQIEVRGGGGDANRADLWFSINSVTHPYKIGGEFQVNTQTENDQTYPAIAALKNGGFVIVWPSQNGSDWDIYGQHYDYNSNKIGGEFLVNSNTSSFQQGADIVGLENGGFIVTWQSFNTNGNDWDIYAQRYDENSNKVGNEFLVNTNTFDQQRNQAVTALKNGGFVITWEHGGQNNDYEIVGQIYDENGGKIGSEFTANSHTDNDQWEANITALKDGGFVITWESQNQDGSFEGVYAQRYDGNGDRVGGEFQVNSQTLDRQETADLTALEDGGFIIVWESDNQDGNSYGIYAQRYDSNGDKVGGEFQVNSHTNQAQRNPSVASLQDGGYLITWTSQGQDGSGEGIYAQRYDSNGNAVGSEMQVNSHTSDSQSTPDLITLTDGNVVIVWDSQNQDGSDRSIFAQRFGVALTTPQVPQPAPPSPSVFHHLNHAYNSLQDSPLEEGASIAPLRVETFEDGVLDTLGVTASAGSLAPSHSIEDNGNSWQVNQESLTLTFDSDLLGALPTRAGVAVTDIANADIGTVAMEIFDSQGVSLGVTQPEALGTGDRFFGVEYEGGISKVTFTANSNDWNIDHLQYG